MIMKIKRIIDLCKKSGSCTLCQQGELQWISDGYSMYPMFELPTFDQISLFNTYDFTEKQKDKIIYRHENHMPEEICFDDISTEETMAEPLRIWIQTGDRELIPYKTTEGIKFVDSRYLDPLRDSDQGYLELYERHNKNGIYFAAKIGMILSGIILPYDAISKEFVDDIRLIAQQCEIALFNKQGFGKDEKDEIENTSSI